MKKRLLITSIVMMLVVAVALGTSTYAWFTSNASVETASITMTATSNTEAALGISWTDGNYTTAISPVIDSSFRFSPVSPASLSTTGTITDSDVGFTTATAKSVGGVFKFNSAGVAADHASYVWNDGEGGHTSFFVKNTSPSNALVGDLTVTATITGTGAELIRVGIFKYNTTSHKYELLGVLANKDDYTYTGISAGAMSDGTYYKLVNGKYVPAVKATDDDVEGTEGEAAQVTAGTADWYVGMTATASQFFTRSDTDVSAKAVYGPIANNTEVNAMPTIDCVESINLVTNLAANTAIEIKVIAWMDGAALGDAEGGHAGNIALSFDVVAPTPAP